MTQRFVCSADEHRKRLTLDDELPKTLHELQKLPEKLTDIFKAIDQRELPYRTKAAEMNAKELAFMTLACETSDVHENGSLFLGKVEPLLRALKQTGMLEKQIWEIQLSLKRAGYIRLHANYNTFDIDPAWSTAASEFTITPLGFKTWLIRKYGQGPYLEMVRNVENTRDEYLKSGVLTVAAWAERLKLPPFTRAEDFARRATITCSTQYQSEHILEPSMLTPLTF
jgi:hypothetical protein